MVKRIFILVLITVCVVAGSCKKAPEEIVHHALLIMNPYQPVQKGANTVIPSETNIMAIDLLGEKKENIQKCQLYIQWYFNHMNPADRYDMSGTINEYEILPDGTERSLNTYSSASEPAATFILLLNRFYTVSGYSNVITRNKDRIKDIAYIVSHLQDEDGLIKEIPASGLKLLKTNCLAYAAMNAYIDLARKMNWEDMEFYTEVRDGIQNGIIESFYNEEKNEFYWKIEGKQKTAVNWENITPDSISQCYPMVYQIAPPNNDLQLLWTKFHKYNKKDDARDAGPVEGIIYHWAVSKMGEKK